MYKLLRILASATNYGGTRKVTKDFYIVWHYTANNGDTPEANGKYFQKPNIKASAHYFVGDVTVVNSVPDTNTAYAVGGNKLASCKTTGGGTMHKKITNANSISIELCDTAKDKIIYPTTQTIANAILLTKSLMEKYGIPANHVYRHFDVTGKLCPAYWCGSAVNNRLWQTEVLDKLRTPEVDYTPVFNASYYANKYEDLARAYGNDKEKLLKHFIAYGMDEGRQARAEFNVHAYRARYTDLQAVYGDHLKQYYLHYINFGVKEGRIGY